MYDDYPSPPSSAGSSSSTRPSILRTTIPHLHSSPLSSHSHTAYGQRASKASDIAHLLDPSYSSHRAACDNQIYVDHAGEAHDPDFRLFAPAPAHYSPKRRFTADLPRNDDDSDDEVEDEGVSLYSYRGHRDDDGVSLYRTQPRRSSLDSANARPSSRASSHKHNHYSTTRPRLDTHDSGYAAFAYTYSPTTVDEDEYDLGFSFDEPRRETNKLRRRRASEELVRPAELDLDLSGLELQQHHTTDGEPRTEWTPSAGHALRRQWHALCLRTQVAAFRARNRVTRVVKPKAATTG